MPAKPIAKYQIHLVKNDKYSWSALLIDTGGETPDQTTIDAKSLAELLAKVLIAVVLRDKNVGVPVEEDAAPTPPPLMPTGPMVLPPSDDPLAAPPPDLSQPPPAPKIIHPSGRIFLGGSN